MGSEWQLVSAERAGGQRLGTLCWGLDSVQQEHAPPLSGKGQGWDLQASPHPHSDPGACPVNCWDLGCREGRALLPVGRLAPAGERERMCGACSPLLLTEARMLLHLEPPSPPPRCLDIVWSLTLTVPPQHPLLTPSSSQSPASGTSPPGLQGLVSSHGHSSGSAHRLRGDPSGQSRRVAAPLPEPGPLPPCVCRLVG